MVTVIFEKKQIETLHKKFHQRLKDFLTEKIHCWVGFPSGSFEDTVKYSPDLDIWISHARHDTKFWNGFGVGKPIEGKGNSLNGEINFSFEGKRSIAGAFAIDDTGKIIVLHRGKIGGGRPGIGKNYFTENFRGDFVSAVDGDRQSEFCLVGELESTHFPQQVANFINEIYRVKNIEFENEPTFAELGNFRYSDEHSGVTVSERTDPRVIERTHGIIVNALALELKHRGHKIGNDRNRDLFIHYKNKITSLFEVKTSSSTQCLYSAVGQLIIYSIPIKGDVNLFAVLPDKLNMIVEKRLTTLGITPIYYEWKKNIPVFKDLSIF